MSDFKVPLALAVAIFSWACAWVSVRVAVVHLSPAHVALARYGIASMVLLPLALWQRPRLEARDIGAFLVLGFLGFTLYNLCINAGEQTVTAGGAALIISTSPIFSALGAALFLGERVSRAARIGIVCGIGGAFLVALGERGTAAVTSAGGAAGAIPVGVSGGALLILLASLCAAAYGLVQKPLLRRYSPLDATTFSIWAGTLLLLPFGGGIVADFQAAPISASWNVLFLGVFPGALGYVLWSYCLSQWPVARVTGALYALPALSIALGWAFLRELPAPLSLVGGALALAGVVWTNWRKNEPAKPERRNGE